MNILNKKLYKIIVGALIAVSLIGVAYVQAGRTNSYSNDKDDLKFTFDVNNSYSINGSMPIEVSLVDINTGSKPQGAGVLMGVDGGSFTTILDENSTIGTRIINLDGYNLSAGSHYLTFSSPDSCGNYFDHSTFDSQTKFNNEYACQYRVDFNVTPEGGTGRCQDNSALNTGDPLPCVYTAVLGCIDPGASNYNQNATVSDGSCIYDSVGCTDPLASNYNKEAKVDDGSCNYEVYGCIDQVATNYELRATADNGKCIYPPRVTSSDFECSVNNRTWVACEGRTFTLNSPDSPIYVRTPAVSGGAWSDWCTGDLNNGVQATFVETTNNGDHADVNFTFSNPGSLFNMVLCLNPDSNTKANSSKNIKLKLLNLKFIEN